MEVRDEDLPMPDGVRLRLTLRRAGHGRALLVVPGILMHRSGPEHQLLARHLARIADVATLDVRRHGDSGGWFTWGRREHEDVARVATWLRSEAGYARVGGLGFSFGGFHACVAAALHGCFDVLATVAAPHRLFLLDHNPLTRGLLRSLPLLLRRERRLTRLSAALLLARPVPSRLAHRVAPTPWLIVHGTADWLVPVRHAHVLHARAAEPKRLLLLDGALHAETMLLDRPAPLLEALAEFFDECLQEHDPGRVSE